MEERRKKIVLVVVQIVDFKIQRIKEGRHCVFGVVGHVEKHEETKTAKGNRKAELWFGRQIEYDEEV